MLLAGPTDPNFPPRYTNMPSCNPAIQMPSTLNVRLQLEPSPVDREKRRRRMSNPEKTPPVQRYRIPLRRSTSGEVLY